MKRILSLDGGGIRGIFSLQILGRIQLLYRQRNADPELVLADVIDLFAGTSIGAIIATCLSWGMSVDEIEQLYVNQSSRMFSPSPWYQRLWSKYRSDQLAEVFRNLFSEDGEGRHPATMASPKLRTLLLVMVRNASTDSPWPLTNNPNALFNDRERNDCNLDVHIWQMLRASTAAPTFFAPECISLGDEQFLFVDGAITPFNNPTLLAVLQATLPQYRIDWPATRTELHVTSVGTGTTRSTLPKKTANKITLFDQLTNVVPALIGSAAFEQDLMCRVLGDCLHGEQLDCELGSLLAPSLLDESQQKFTYVRYDQRIDVKCDLNPTPLRHSKIDDLRLMPQLIELGKRYAEHYVKAEHLAPRSKG